MEHCSGNHILSMRFKSSKEFEATVPDMYNCVCVTRTLPAMVGRLVGVEVMVAASAGEVQGEGEMLPNQSPNLEIYRFPRFSKLLMCPPNI